MRRPRSTISTGRSSASKVGSPQVAAGEQSPRIKLHATARKYHGSSLAKPISECGLVCISLLARGVVVAVLSVYMLARARRPPSWRLSTLEPRKNGARERMRSASKQMPARATATSCFDTHLHLRARIDTELAALHILIMRHYNSGKAN